MDNDGKPEDRHGSSRHPAEDRSTAYAARPDCVVVVRLHRPRARIGTVAPLPDEKAELGGIAVLGYN